MDHICIHNYVDGIAIRHYNTVMMNTSITKPCPYTGMLCNHPIDGCGRCTVAKQYK